MQYGQGRGIGGYGGGKREVSSVSMSELTMCLEDYDSSLNVLQGLAVAAACFPTAEIIVVGANSTTTVTATEVIISGFSMSKGEGPASVSLSL